MSIPIKNARDMEAMRLSCRAAATVKELVAMSIEPGMTTKEIDDYAGELIAQTGGVPTFLGYRGFPANICVSVNEEVVHGIGGSRRIAMGDLVKLDVGVTLNGFVGDTATTVAVGEVGRSSLELMRWTQEALNVGISFARVGNRVGKVSHNIELVARKHGLGVVREFVGHGVGRTLHEEPQVPNYGPPRNGPKLRPGMTLAIEPMFTLARPEVKVLDDKWTVVTRDNSLCAHFEHTVHITDSDPEILTIASESIEEFMELVAAAA